MTGSIDIRRVLGDRSYMAQEQSMEEILSTIKRVIAKDQATRTTPGAAPVRPQRAAAKAVAEPPAPIEADDVLELTVEVTPKRDEPVEEIVSTSVAEASRNALSALAAKKAAAQSAHLDIGNKTIEQLVAEMLRPMLKDWLDANLPDMVERMVAKEIARITEEEQ